MAAVEEAGTMYVVANIRNTALILVGRFLGNDYELSKLYDASFSHGFRAASQ